MTTDKLVTVTEIAEILGCQRRTVADKYVHEPDFPAPARAVHIRAREWRREDIDAWAASRTQQVTQRRASRVAAP